MSPPDDAHLQRLAAELGAGLMARGERFASAESCTGGLIAKIVTDLPGSSRWFEGGVVSYSNAMKQGWLGVPEAELQAHGAVSAAVVNAMVAGLLARSGAHWGVAVSGVAGPDGGTPDKPVGTVWMAWAGGGAAPSASRFRFDGDRDAVRRLATQAAFQGLLHQLGRAD